MFRVGAYFLAVVACTRGCAIRAGVLVVARVRRARRIYADWMAAVWPVVLWMVSVGGAVIVVAVSILCDGVYLVLALWIEVW